MAAQLIFLGDLVELVCSFTDLKILTKLLERMDIDIYGNRTFPDEAKEC